MTSKSKLANMALFPRDVAGDRDAGARAGACAVTTTTLISRYITVAAVKASNTWNENSCIERASPVNSIRPMVMATAVFLMVLRNSEVSGGRMMRNAIGSST